MQMKPILDVAPATKIALRSCWKNAHGKHDLKAHLIRSKCRKRVPAGDAVSLPQDVYGSAQTGDSMPSVAIWPNTGLIGPKSKTRPKKLIALLDDESNGLPDLVCSTARMHIGHIDAFSAKIGVFDKQVKMTEIRERGKVWGRSPKVEQ